MPANTITVAAGYVLMGDGKELGFVLKPRFQTVNAVGFQISSVMLGLFTDGFGLRKGCLPYQNLSLGIFDYSMREIMRYSWRQAVVTQIDFPRLDAGDNKLLEFFIWLSVVVDTRSAPAAKKPDLSPYLPKLSPSSPPKRRVDPLPNFAFRLQIDGLESALDILSGIEAFTVTPDGAGSLVVVVVPEGLANPFRDWLQNGNSPQSGHLDYLDTSLRTALKLNFTGLRVQTIVPAMTTFSASPARITLSYSSIGIVWPAPASAALFTLPSARARR